MFRQPSSIARKTYASETRRHLSRAIASGSSIREIPDRTAAPSLGLVALAQGNTKVTDVQPIAGKVNDAITVTGENLGKPAVSNKFLSDDKNGYKATVLEQSGAQ